MQTYYADEYLRLSVADGDKAESDSINNQRELIDLFLKSHPEIKLHKERVDDGYSGVDFDRPSFREMMNDIRSGKVNCVIYPVSAEITLKWVNICNRFFRLWAFGLLP